MDEFHLKAFKKMAVYQLKVEYFSCKCALPENIRTFKVRGDEQNI